LNSAVNYNESELVLLLKQRKAEGFHYLYDHYAGALYAAIVNIVSDRETANDVLQDVFIKVWKQIETYDEARGRLFTWMLNIARNAGIDIVRSKSYQRNRENKELTDTVYDTVGGVKINTDKIGLRSLVHKLKDDYKILVELSYFQGYTQDEIAKMLNIPLGTVKTRLRSALIQLKQVLKP